MKVLSIIGSCAGESSGTALLSDRLFATLNSGVFGGGAEYERITLDEVSIDHCISCDTCFKQCFCPADSSDDMGAIKNKIKECDIFILGSPVYLCHVSGACKSLIDRMAYWSHSMELAGKLSFAVSTASSNHLRTAVDYLTQIMRVFGCIVVSDLAVYTTCGSPDLKDNGEMEELLGKCASNLKKALYSPELFITELQEQYFSSLQRRYKKQLRLNETVLDFLRFNEAEHWRDSGFLEADSFKELVLKRKNSYER